jgi:hypothetical protein
MKLQASGSRKVPNVTPEPELRLAPQGTLVLASPCGVRFRKHPTPMGHRSSMPSMAGLIFAAPGSAREFAPPLRSKAKRTGGKLLGGW